MKNPRVQSLPVNGLKLKFYHWGKVGRPKLFLFHGWLDTGAGFHFLAERLQDKFHCIAPDLRGYGKSAHAPDPLGYFFYQHVADMDAILRYFSPKEPVRLLGHSLGGAIAGVYAGGFPERVRDFINVEGFTFRDNPPERGPSKLRHWLEEISRQRFQTFKTLGHFAERLRSERPRLTRKRAVFLARHLTKRTKAGYTMAADPRQKVAEPYVWVREVFYRFWGSIRARCLLVSAQHSEMNQWVKAKNLKADIAERLRHFPKTSRKVVIADCGHMVHHEQPEDLAGQILRFL